MKKNKTFFTPTFIFVYLYNRAEAQALRPSAKQKANPSLRFIIYPIRYLLVDFFLNADLYIIRLIKLIYFSTSYPICMSVNPVSNLPVSYMPLQKGTSILLHELKVTSPTSRTEGRVAPWMLVMQEREICGAVGSFDH